MTPLHILAMNPYADSGAILACFGANMNAVFVGDSRGNTPLDYLRVYHDIEDHTLVVASLCNWQQNHQATLLVSGGDSTRIDNF